MARTFPKAAQARWEKAHRVNAERLATGCMRLRGVFIKVGQVLSVIGSFLPSAYAQALSRLQDKVPAQPFPEVEQRLIEALGEEPLSLFQTFEREPLAAASLAQVHRARDRKGQELAVKVLYPGIERLIRQDLAVLRSTVPVLKRIFPIAHLSRVLDQLEAMLRRETDYDNERRNIETIRELFSGNSDVVIPQVVSELSRGPVLSLSFESGTKISDVDELVEQGVDPGKVAEILVGCYFDMLLKYRTFHADPHPGNFLVRKDDSEPKLVILDFGAVEKVTDALAKGMKTVVLGVLAQDDEQILEGLETMGFVAPNGNRELLGQVGRRYLKVLAELDIQNFSQLDKDTIEKLSGYEQMRGRLREIMRSVEYPEGYFYVERTLVLLFGLVGQLVPEQGLTKLILPFAARAFATQESSS